MKLKIFSKTKDGRRPGRQNIPFIYSITMKIISQLTSELLLCD